MKMTICDRTTSKRKTNLASGRGLDDVVVGLDHAAIAELPPTHISQMDCDELVRVVRIAQLPFLSTETNEHLELRDRQTLERLANLARLCCRNRTARRSRESVISGGV